MNNDILLFGSLLKNFRKRRKVTQQQIAKAIGLHRNTIGRWEQGDFYPENKRIVLDLAKFLHLNEQETRLFLETSFTTLAPYWYIPYPRNPFFTGREHILQQIHMMLHPNNTGIMHQTCALTGLGGIGKTQTAIEYAYRYVNEYTAVLWINGETRESVLSSAIAIANVLHLLQKSESDQNQILATVLQWLSTHNKWLLILDNIEETEPINEFLQLARCSSLLFTTRKQTLGITSCVYSLEVMTVEEGCHFLLQRTRQWDVYTPQIEEDTTAQLVAFLGGLPLALDQAGAYIEETGCSVSNYLQLCTTQRHNLLAHRGIHTGVHPDSVATTLTLSVQQIRQKNQAAAELLDLCAFLHADAIYEELIITGAPFLGPVLQPVVTDPYQFDLTLASLRSASLIHRSSKTRTISIHRLIQAVLQDQMDSTKKQVWSERIIRMIHATFPDEEDFEHWDQSERYLGHVMACIPMLQAMEIPMIEGCELLVRAGSYLIERGRLQEAEPLLEQAISLGEQIHTADHPLLLPWLMRRAELFWRKGEYDRTELLLRRVLMIAQKHLEPTDTTISETLSNLASLFVRQGNYEQAEPLYQRALTLCERYLEEAHPLTINTLSNLATLHSEQGNYEQAELLYKRALMLSEQQWNAEHLEMIGILYQLACLYQQQKYTEKAKSFYLRALSIGKQHLGDNHPQVIKISTAYNSFLFEMASTLNTSITCDVPNKNMYG